MAASARRLQVPDVGRPGDKIMLRSRDLQGTSFKHGFYIKLAKTLNLF